MNIKLFFVLVSFLFFFGCTSLDEGLVLIDDANYITDSNISDSNFTNLNDTPANYIGAGSQCVAVNVGETGLEFIVCAASGLPDTTLDVNINALFNFLGKSYDWNKDQNFVSSNVFELNLGKDSFSVNGVDFNVFDLNTSVLNECSGDANHVLTSANLCQFIGGYGSGGSGGVGDGNFYSIPDHNILFAKISDVNENFLLIADSNNFARLIYEAIADWNIAVLNAQDWNALGIDSNCSVSGSCPLIAYKDRDELITGDANWTFTNDLRTRSLIPYSSGEISGAAIGTPKYRFNNSYYTENLFNVANCQVGGCSSEVGYFYLEPNAGVDQNNFFIDFSAFKNIVNVVSDPYKLILYDLDYVERFYVDANGNSWFDGNVSIDLNLLVDGSIFTECIFFEDGTSFCTNNFLTTDSNIDSNVWSEGFLNDSNAFNYDVNAQDRNGYFESLSIGNGVSPITTNFKRGILVGGSVDKGITLLDSQTGYRALSSEVTVNTTASLLNVFGYYSRVTLKGANAVTNLVGAYGNALVNSAIFTDTLTNLIGLRATVENTGATVTNAFGLLVDDVTAGTNNYAIKTGTGLNWFGDDLNIQGDLNVSQDANIMGNVFIGGDLNVLGNLHVDQNIIAESSLGKAMLIPDENRMCIGTETVFCMGLTCNATGDCNANFEFI